MGKLQSSKRPLEHGLSTLVLELQIYQNLTVIVSVVEARLLWIRLNDNNNIRHVKVKQLPPREGWRPNNARDAAVCVTTNRNITPVR